MITAIPLQAGDRVGIKDAADFLHWSRFGHVQPGALGGEAPAVSVLEDGFAEPVPVRPELLVRLGATGESDAWYAQAFPVDGEAPGLKMYFANALDVVQFVREFQAASLSDERLQVHPGAAATPDQIAQLQAQGIQLVT
jgi:hypothetical protein